MAVEREKMNAEVVSVLPNKVKIVVDELKDFQLPSEKLKVGSYVRISDSEDAVMLAIIENYSIESILNAEGEPDRRYILEANPLGILRDGDFERGGDTIAIPPKDVKPATRDDIDAIYAQSIADKEKFVFANLASTPEIAVPVNGNKFFNKHIAIVGSTGSGKSHTVAKIIQSATTIKEGTYDGMNNSHIIIFDIHSEYKAAFPSANYLDVADIVLPYKEKYLDDAQMWALKTYSNMLSEQIFVPIEDSNKKFEYTPFQTMAKYFEGHGFGGIIYKSTKYDKAKNLVLFDKNSASPIGSIDDYIIE